MNVKYNNSSNNNGMTLEAVAVPTKTKSARSAISSKLVLLIGLIIVGALAVYMILRNSGKEIPEDQNISDEDLKLLGKTGKSKISAPDLSPIKGDIVISGNKDYDEVAHANLVAGITKKYSSQLDEAIKALHPDRDKRIIGAGLGYILGSSEYDISARALDSYMTLSTVCAKAFSQIDGDCVKAIADVAGKISSSIASAQTCHTYEYTQKTQELNKFYQNETTTTKVTNKGGSVLFGLLARGKSSGKSISVNSVKEETKQRTVDYIPHCKGKTVDGAVLEALLSTQSNALKTILSISAEGWNKFPTPESFFSKA